MKLCVQHAPSLGVAAAALVIDSVHGLVASYHVNHNNLTESLTLFPSRSRPTGGR